MNPILGKNILLYDWWLKLILKLKKSSLRYLIWYAFAICPLNLNSCCWNKGAKCSALSSGIILQFVYGINIASALEETIHLNLSILKCWVFCPGKGNLNNSLNNIYMCSSLLSWLGKKNICYVKKSQPKSTIWSEHWRKHLNLEPLLGYATARSTW